MTHVHTQPLRVDYRLHIPYFRSAVAAGLMAVVLGGFYRFSPPANLLISNLVIGAGAVLLLLTLGFWGFVQLFNGARKRLRDLLRKPTTWRGDEMVLDVGTGSGILLFACAKQLRTGHATGIDIYDPHAGGGSAEIFWRNAQAEGVAEHVELRNEDARQMTFAAAAFDVIVSSLAMHHMGGVEDRRRAMAEMVRVLKPRGKVFICDLTAVLGDCEDGLQRGGLVNVQRRRVLLLFSILSAEKP